MQNRKRLKEFRHAKKESDKLTAALEATRDYFQNLTEITQEHCVGRAGFHMENLRAALTETSAHNHVQPRSLSELPVQWLHMVVLWVGQSVSREGSNWFCGRCRHVYILESRQSNLVSETWTRTNRRSFAQSLPLPAGEVETFSAIMRLKTNLRDGKVSYDEEEKPRQRIQTTYGVIESIRNFINKDQIKAMMTMGDDLNRAFDDRVVRVHPTHKATCSNLEVMNNRDLTLLSHDSGSVKAWVQFAFLKNALGHSQKIPISANTLEMRSSRWWS